MGETASGGASDGDRPPGRDRDQAIRDIVKGAGVVYVGLVLEMGISFVAQVLTANFLSPGGFGVITTGVAVINLGGIVGSLGVGRGFARYLPRYESERRRKVVRSMFVVVVPLSLLLGGLLVAGADVVATVVFDAPEVGRALRVFGATVPFSTVLTVAVGGIRGMEHPRYRVYVQNFLRPTTRFLLVALAIAYGANAVGFAVAYAVPYVLGAVVATLLLRRTFAPATAVRGFDWRSGVEVVRYSLPLMLAALSSFVYRSVDIFLVLAIRGTASVGVYGVVYGLAGLVLVYSTAVNYLSLPVVSELEKDGRVEEMFDVQLAVLRWMALALAPVLVPFVFYPEVVVDLFYKPVYVSGATTLAILAAGFGASNLVTANGNLVQARGNSRLIAASNLVAGLLNLCLNLVLIPVYGIEGAAAATVAAYLGRDAVQAVGLRWNTGRWLVDGRLAGTVLVSLPLLATAAVVAARLPRTLPYAVVVTAAFGVAYLATSVVVLGFREEDLMLVHSVEGKLGVQLSPLTSLIDRFS